MEYETMASRPRTTARELDQAFERLTEEIEGDVRHDRLWRLLYAQDASVYAEEPLGVAFPRHREDLQALVRVAAACGIPLIPRAAGTSLAGQCVGEGLVVDTGRHMNQILEVNAEERWVRVQPGVILDDLNRYLRPTGLYFAPDTSTSNRCMIGGMIGNNSCGSHSILYGNTMRHVLELGAVFADGEYAHLGPWSEEQLRERMAGQGVLARGLRTLDRIVCAHPEAIEAAYPPPEVVRRNTGYPLDDILARAPYGHSERPFSLARFLCGTEGTLAFTTEAKLNLEPRPKGSILVCAHFASLMEALEATVVAVQHDPAAVELVDRRILEQTRFNLEQQRNRFFVEGDPDGILIIEFYRDTDDELESAVRGIIEALKGRGMGYAFPVVRPPDDKKVWDLRKAGLGLLMGIPGDTKAVSVVEDTAVPVEVLPAYIGDFMAMMERYGTQSVYHAHASVGELHLRPELNLRDPVDVEKFEAIAKETALLVKGYRGSLSGEHGDGRVRGPLLRDFFGDEVYGFHEEVKAAFDPKGILNPHKIVDAEPIDADFRVPPGVELPEPDTLFDWSSDMGLLRAAEKCNGAGACRKRAEAGGTMCPSYMVTLDERDTTRGRANVFRQLLLEGPSVAWDSEELHDALDLCLSCKGCKSECPASVDMARMKAEFLQHHHDRHGLPLAARFFGYYGALSRLAAIAPRLANWMMTLGLVRWIIGKVAGIAPERELPRYADRPFRRQWKSYRRAHPTPARPVETVWLYVDPFTEYTDPEIALDAVRVIEASGRAVELLPVRDDGRTFLSKGMVRQAQEVLQDAMRTLRPLLAEHPERAIVGVEPSALLTFRDEAPDLVGPELRDTAVAVAERALLLDEFVAERAADDAFDVAWKEGVEPALLHGHCHQKAIAGIEATKNALGLAGYEVSVIPSGCCGMAGSFGYEADHYEVSMAVGELVLFPALREAEEAVHVAAPGTSCRHQIADGVGRVALHPATLLARRLR